MVDSRRPRRLGGHSRWRGRTAGALTAALAVALGMGAPAEAADGQIEGTGSTWSQVIVDQWISDVNAFGMKVVYAGGGSSKGRKDFAYGSTDFAISEIPYQGADEYGNPDTSGGREYSYLPIVAGGTAFTYHLEQGGTLVRDIRLSGPTIAKIFTNQITSWADPAIKADNNGRVLPDTPIVPVVRSDGSGTTAQFTTWLDKAQPDIWQPYLGRSGTTLYYPKKSGTSMIAANGSDQVMNSVAAKSGNGTIAYVENSYPVNRGYPVVKVLNAAGYYVEPTQYAVAVALTKAKINQDKSSQNYLTQILDEVYTNPDPRAYPLSSYSYMIIPTGADDPRMTTNKRQTLVDFISYSLCEGQSEAGSSGYAPLPLNLVQAGFEQLAKLGAADPGVDIANRNATTCNNPTFVAGDLGRDKLAEIAAAPPSCDQQGQGPCLSEGQPGGGTGNGPLTLALSVPESPFGALSLSLASSAPVPLPATRDGGGAVSATATLPGVVVRDTRVDSRLSLWQVNVQSSAFQGSGGTVDAAYLGWTPRLPLSEPAQGSPLVAQAGAPVASALADAGSHGLAQSRTLGSARVPGRGVTTLSADLALLAPESTPAGTFAATVTITLVAS